MAFLSGYALHYTPLAAVHSVHVATHCKMKRTLHPHFGAQLCVSVKGSDRGRQRGKTVLAAGAFHCCWRSLPSTAKGYSSGEAVGHYAAKNSNVDGEAQLAE